MGGGKSWCCCPHHSPHSLPFRSAAGSTPHRDAAGQDAFCGASVECSEDGQGQGRWTLPICLWNRCCALLTKHAVFNGPDEVIFDVHQEHSAADHLHSGCCWWEAERGWNDSFWRWQWLVGFIHIQDEIADSAGAYQLLHILFVCQVVVIPDETHYHCVIHKLQDVVGGSCGDSRVSWEWTAGGSALRGACVESDGTGGVVTYSHWLWSFSEEVQQRGPEAQRSQFIYQILWIKRMKSFSTGIFSFVSTSSLYIGHL